MSGSPVSSTRLYLAIWGWLAGLMLLGVFLSEWPLLRLPRATIVAVVVEVTGASREIDEREQEDPHDVHEVPVQPGVLKPPPARGKGPL